MLRWPDRVARNRPCRGPCRTEVVSLPAYLRNSIRINSNNNDHKVSLRILYARTWRGVCIWTLTGAETLVLHRLTTFYSITTCATQRRPVPVTATRTWRETILCLRLHPWPAVLRAIPEEMQVPTDLEDRVILISKDQWPRRPRRDSCSNTRCICATH